MTSGVVLFRRVLVLMTLLLLHCRLADPVQAHARENTGALCDGLEEADGQELIRLTRGQEWSHVTQEVTQVCLLVAGDTSSFGLLQVPLELRLLPLEVLDEGVLDLGHV